MRQGRPKDGPEDKFSLKQVVPRLSECLGSTVRPPPTHRSEACRRALLVSVVESSYLAIMRAASGDAGGP